MTCQDCKLYKGDQQCYRYPPNANGSRAWVKPTDPACGEFQAAEVVSSGPLVERIVPQFQPAATEQTTSKQTKRK